MLILNLEIMGTLKQLTSKSSKTAFDKKVLSAIHHLHPYVKHRIYIGESTGIIPKNMYSSNGIIDDCVIAIYESGYNLDANITTIKLKLFKLVDEHLNELFKKEAFHQYSVSTDEFLKKELARLNEDFTVDADMDLILNTELTDISYHQNKDNKIYLYEDKENSFVKALDISSLKPSESPQIVGQFYSWLPVNISNIVDLYIFGNLEFEDIAKIKNIEVKRVETIFKKVKNSFRSHLE